MQKENIQRWNKFVEGLNGKTEKGDYHIMSLCPVHGDARLSLWVRMDEAGKINAKCHAGCTIDALCKKLGFEDMSILYPKARIIDRFDYMDIEGGLVYQEVKFDLGKDRFQARRKDKKGVWKYDVKDIPRILYNLYEVTCAINAGVDSAGKPIEKGVDADGESGANTGGKNSESCELIIFMCEGAKDARTVVNLGLTSTAALFNDWAKTDTSPLDGQNVIILVDNDEGGEIKALAAAQDRYRKSKSIKLLRLPGLSKGGDVTDWLLLGGTNTKEKLIELARDVKLEEYSPQDTVRKRVEGGELTGLSYEHHYPRPIVEDYLEYFHPPEDGPLYFYDEEWLKGNPDSKLFSITARSEWLNSITKFLDLCFNRSGKRPDDLFKSTPREVKEILESGEWMRDLNVIKNPNLPIFNPFHMPEIEKNYKREDIIIMKDHNFYIPERHIYPRNMEACQSLYALPFNYEQEAKCPEIEKSFSVQWPDDCESTNLFLQFVYYCMLHTHVYNTILCLIGPSKGGKSKKLDLIRSFLGPEGCEALSLGKIGKQFELYRARNAKLLICDDISLTRRDLSEGSVIENIKSIPSGGAIRIEKKSGKVYSRILPCQIIMAGNEPPKIPELSDALSKRFKFLYFGHIYEQGKDMNPNIIDVWVKELPGLMNLVLDSGCALIANEGFVEPASSWKIRDKFETGGNKILHFVKSRLTLQGNGEVGNFYVLPEDMKLAYSKYCEDEGIQQMQLSSFYELLESVGGIERKHRRIKVRDDKSGGFKDKIVRCWSGCELKNSADTVDSTENDPAF